MKEINYKNWGSLSPEEKKKELYVRQKELLDEFLSRGAITKAQYDKSFGDLREKMGMPKDENENM